MLPQPTPQMIQHPASVESYIRHGWSLVPIPPNTKGPRSPGWQLKENALKSQADLPVGYGIGLAHAYSGTMAFDIDDWGMCAGALAIKGIDLNALYNAPDAVVVDSGRAGHGKLLYAMPFGMAPITKKVITEGKTVYELRCASATGLTVQDVLPPSIHPTTGKPYTWAGTGHWSRLPTIPDALLDHWHELLDQDKERSIKVSGEAINANWEEIQAAVEHIPADCSRDEWVTVGMALHWAGTQTQQSDQALYLWNEWSKESPNKYPGEREILTQWQSFKTDKANSVKLGSLFHIAKRHGWVRPAVDVSELFKNHIKLSAPEQVLKSLAPPAPRADLSLFPIVLATRAEQIGISVGCDPMVPLWAGLAAVCGVANAESRLELLDGFQVPPVLWLMTIGEPADKKTPGSTPMFDTLADLEMEDRPRHRKALLDWEGREAMYSAAHKAFIQFNESPEALLGGQAPSVPDLPPQPVPLRIKVSDVTSQKLVRLAADRPRGLLCHLDEMAGWVRKLCDKSSSEDRSAWTVSYEAKSYDMDRVGAGTIHAENLAISIYGNIQPRVLRESIAPLSADGLLQRFVPVILDGSLTKKPEPIPPYMRNDNEWAQALRAIFSLPPMTYKLDSEAYKAYRGFQDWYQQRRNDERLLQSDEAFMTAFGKLEGLTGRIALIFHLIEAPFEPNLTGDLMRRAIRFAQSYIVPALRTALCDIGGSSTFERWVHDWIIQHADKQTVTMSDIKRAARRQLESVHPNQQESRVMVAMIPLEDAGYCIRLDDLSGTHRAQWAINPALVDQHAGYRQQVIEAKQRRLDEIYKDNPKDTKHYVYGFTG
jgi:hypothetical protein